MSDAAGQCRFRGLSLWEVSGCHEAEDEAEAEAAREARSRGEEGCIHEYSSGVEFDLQSERSAWLESEYDRTIYHVSVTSSDFIMMDSSEIDSFVTTRSMIVSEKFYEFRCTKNDVGVP